MMNSKLDNNFMSMRHDLYQRIATIERAVRAVTASIREDARSGGGDDGEIGRAHV